MQRCGLKIALSPIPSFMSRLSLSAREFLLLVKRQLRKRNVRKRKSFLLATADPETVVEQLAEKVEVTRIAIIHSHRDCCGLGSQ